METRKREWEKEGRKKVFQQRRKKGKRKVWVGRIENGRFGGKKRGKCEGKAGNEV